MDADGDGYSNLQEYEAGTNPTSDIDKPEDQSVNRSFAPSVIMYLLN